MQERPHTLEFWRGRLPHWEVADSLHFVTIHLEGAIPAEAARRIRRMIAPPSDAVGQNRIDASWRIFQEMELWLDSSGEVRHLANPSVAVMVMDAIEYRMKNGTWNVHEYVLMPSHAHLLLELLSQGLTRSLRSFKQWTSSRARKILKLGPGQFWQTEWFDHWVRTSEEAESITA